MDAVGADQHVAARGRAVRAAAVEEICGDAAIVLREGAEPVTEMEAALAEPRARRLVDDVLQLAAMDRELRHVEARIGAAQLAPDLLPEAVEIEQLVGADRDRVEPLQQPEFLQLLDGVRQRVDADAKLADAVGLLIDLALDAARMQHQRGDEPAHSSAGNDGLHALERLTQRRARMILRSQWNRAMQLAATAHRVIALYVAAPQA